MTAAPAETSTGTTEQTPSPVETGAFDFIEKYQALRAACHEAVNKNPALLGDDQWLRVAFSNAGPEGIYHLDVAENGIECNSSCYTSQTGGSTEFIDFTVPFALLDQATVPSNQG